ncbi:hypothetical protein AHAS_Ahas20G0219500 [Arachis hypogaea]
MSPSPEDQYTIAIIVFIHGRTQAAPLLSHPPRPLLRQPRHLPTHHLLLPLSTRQSLLRCHPLFHPPKPWHLSLQHSYQSLLPLLNPLHFPSLLL